MRDIEGGVKHSITKHITDTNKLIMIIELGKIIGMKNSR